ncbi:MAG: hypothetical protein ACPGLY_09015 [Rubripirellula sp.]
MLIGDVLIGDVLIGDVLIGDVLIGGAAGLHWPSRLCSKEPEPETRRAREDGLLH